MDEHLLHAFERCAADGDEVRVATLVAQTLDPAVRPRAVAAELDALAAQRPPHMTPWFYLHACGFAGNLRDYTALDNSNLARVLATRRGIPISLGVVLIHVARHAGHVAGGVNFPGHFLVEVDGDLVDPFVMEDVTRAGMRERLASAAADRSDTELFPPASVVDLGLRMLNNVKLIHSQVRDWERALEVLEAQLRLAPEHPALHLERGDFWQRLGLTQPARAAFEQAWRLAESHPQRDALREAAAARLKEL